MTMLRQFITVRCPRCEVVIAPVTPETMVYCIACRKWCREIEELPKPALATAAPPARKTRRYRCH